MKLTLSTSARLALLNAGILITGFSILLLGVTWLAERLMHAHVRESVTSELELLHQEHLVHGIAGVKGLIEGRLKHVSRNHQRVYRLEAPVGKFLLGNLDAWPVNLPGELIAFELPSLLNPRGGQVFAAWVGLEGQGRLLVGFDEMEIAQVQADLRLASLYGFAILLLLSLTLGFLITRAAFRPVEAIRLAAERILSGDLRHRVPMSGAGDDFDRLSQTLNVMLKRIDFLVSSIRGATDNLAHDLLSPLTRHRARLESMLRNLPDENGLTQSVEASLEDVDRVLSTCQSLLRIAKVETGSLRADFSRCDVATLVADVAELMGSLAEDRRQQLCCMVQAGPALWGHRDLLFQLLVNLIDNAIKFAPDGSQISLTVRLMDREWVFDLKDKGPGIPISERDKVFERLVRLDSSRATPGVGLGLSMVKACVDLHHGSVTITDGQPGCHIVVTIPMSLEPGN